MHSEYIFSTFSIKLWNEWRIYKTTTSKKKRKNGLCDKNNPIQGLRRRILEGQHDSLAKIDITFITFCRFSNDKITNQKNGRTGQTLHQESTGPQNAVEALAHRVYHILNSGGSDRQLLCDVFQDDAWISVQSSEIVIAVRNAAKALKLHNVGNRPGHDRGTFIACRRRNGPQSHGIR